MRELILSEEGGIVEWLVGALIIGIGCIPVIVGLVQAVLGVAEKGEETIRNMVRSGY